MLHGWGLHLCDAMLLPMSHGYYCFEVEWSKGVGLAATSPLLWKLIGHELFVLIANLKL